MTDKNKELTDRFADLSRQAHKLVEDKGDSVWTDEEQANFDDIVNAMNNIKACMKREEDLRQADADAFFKNIQEPQSKNDKKVSFENAFKNYLRKGPKMDTEDLQILNEALNTGTDSAGGYTVPEELANYIINRMKAFGGMRQAADVISTTTGVKMNFPTSDGTEEMGEIVAENAGVSELAPTFGIRDLEVFKYSSKYIAVSWELLQDSNVDIVRFIVNRLSERIARIQNNHFTVGTGTGQPKGMITAATGATAVTAINFDSMMALIHSIDPAYRQGAYFMANDAAILTMSTLKDTTGRPLWLPDIVGGTPGTFLGKRILLNQDMPTANPVAYGDFKGYTIRDVRNSIEMRRFDEWNFAQKGQIGFCQWMRSGGNLLIPDAIRKMVVQAATPGVGG